MNSKWDKVNILLIEKVFGTRFSSIRKWETNYLISKYFKSKLRFSLNKNN